MTETVNTETVSTSTACTQNREEKLKAKYGVLLARIRKDSEVVQELVAELNSIAALAGVDVGSHVLVKLGRAETTREVAGVVIGVKMNDDWSKVYKVQYGEGFGAEITIVGAAKISVPVTPDVAA